MPQGSASGLNQNFRSLSNHRPEDCPLSPETNALSSCPAEVSPSYHIDTCVSRPLPVPYSVTRLARSPSAQLASGPQLEGEQHLGGAHALQAHPSHQRVEARARSHAFSEHWVMLTDHAWGKTHSAEPTETQRRKLRLQEAPGLPQDRRARRQQSPSEPSFWP